MSQRVVFGPFTHAPIAVVREHGTRVECIGLVPWLVPQLIEFATSPWHELNHWTHQSPARSVMESLDGAA